MGEKLPMVALDAVADEELLPDRRVEPEGVPVAVAEPLGLGAYKGVEKDTAAM